MTDTTPKEPLLTQRKVQDVEANPAEVVEAKRPVAQTQEPPPTLYMDPDFKRFYTRYPLLTPLGAWLPPIISIWLYLHGMRVLSHYHPARDWPDPFASIAAACIKTENKRISSCENIFYVQVSTLLFCSCALFNSLAWMVLWTVGNRLAGLRPATCEIYGCAGASAGIVTMLGCIFSSILTLFYLCGYSSIKCGEGDLPECVFNTHPAFFDVAEWLIVEIAIVACFVASIPTIMDFIGPRCVTCIFREED